MTRAHLLLLLFPAACSGGGGSSAPLSAFNAPLELVLVRTETGDEHRTTELLIRSVQGLGDRRVAPHSGREIGVRSSPDGTTVAYTRQRQRDDPTSQEIFVAPVDGSAEELRLTFDTAIDDGPCWSPDGARLLFSSDRSGERRLWTIDADGQNLALFLADGPARDPDWNGPTDRILFSRLDASTSRWQLFSVQADGTGLLQITDGGAGTDDLEAAFAPTGATALFRRVLGPDHSELWQVDLAGGQAIPLQQGNIEARFPRWSPLGDRLFVSLSFPDAGRKGLRLHELDGQGADPVLLQPDARYQWFGCDVLPDLGVRPAREAPQLFDYPVGHVRVDGVVTLGSVASLRMKDGNPLMVATVPFNDRQVAAVRVESPLPIGDPLRVVRLRVRVVAAVQRADGDTVLRLTLRNHVERRNDTVVEIAPGGTGWQTLEFCVGSHAHIDRNGWINAAIIADVAPGDRTELWVDHFEIEFTLEQAVN